ncbi:hypothetical protein [Phocaeicola dorei]|jgi:hypothetical protein|uniref:hypothetical protein n=1 Tax=Phocaeicola dorei TaxID=357276 RepID=UPI001BDEBE47|nr:hypothetical protein [Phocaeicola dorei]MBT1285806.1 hypothetical protein [Phocaeicola dorei]MBT1289673.1 hypothetical protein [Phocaeicola dorei]
MEIDLANVISACGTVVAAYLAYNQYTKNKITDLKVEYFKKEEERKSYKRSENTAKVFGELWRILYELKADRVYIVQPHPLGHVAFLSIQFEVKRKGVSGMLDSIQTLPMSEVANFSKVLAENLFLFYTDIDNEVKDKVAKSLLSVNGCKAVAIKRLNSSADWVGNIFCEFTDRQYPDEETIHHVLHEAAINIQYILPEVRERKI